MKEFWLLMFKVFSRNHGEIFWVLLKRVENA
jgi:hypothetical protein